MTAMPMKIAPLVTARVLEIIISPEGCARLIVKCPFCENNHIHETPYTGSKFCRPSDFGSKLSKCCKGNYRLSMESWPEDESLEEGEISGSPAAAAPPPILKDMIRNLGVELNDCMELLSHITVPRSKTHMLLFSKLLGMASVLTYYVAHQLDAMLPNEELRRRRDCVVFFKDVTPPTSQDAVLSLGNCKVLCDDILSSIDSHRPMDTVKVNQILMDILRMLTAIQNDIPLRILHSQPSDGEALMVDDMFPQKMAAMLAAAERARDNLPVHGTTYVTALEADNGAVVPEVLNRLNSDVYCYETMTSPIKARELNGGISSLYYEGCGAPNGSDTLGAPALAPSLPVVRSLTFAKRCDSVSPSVSPRAARASSFSPDFTVPETSASPSNPPRSARLESLSPEITAPVDSPMAESPMGGQSRMPTASKHPATSPPPLVGRSHSMAYSSPPPLTGRSHSMAFSSPPKKFSRK